VHALEIADEGLSEILLAIDDVSRQMIQPCPSSVGQIDGEELNDEKVIIHSARLRSKAVVLLPDTGVSFVIILDDAARHSKTLWEASVTHGTSEHLRPGPFKAEAMPFMIVLASAAHHRPVSGADDTPGVLTKHLDGPTGHRPKTVLGRRTFLP
jgi:hypothetical protein